jgi:hypothetical protein
MGHMAANYPDNRIELDDSLRRSVEQLAESTGQSATEILRKAVEDYLLTHGSNGGHLKPSPRRRLAELADAASADMTADDWAKLPTDLARNFEHYRYGYPRED